LILTGTELEVKAEKKGNTIPRFDAMIAAEGFEELELF
jgi:hypothetical protein